MYQNVLGAKVSQPLVAKKKKKKKILLHIRIATITQHQIVHLWTKPKFTFAQLSSTHIYIIYIYIYLKDQPAHGVTVIFVELNNTKIELLKPLGDKSPIKNFLEKNPAGGIHHVCLEVINHTQRVVVVTHHSTTIGSLPLTLFLPTGRGYQLCFGNCEIEGYQVCAFLLLLLLIPITLFSLPLSLSLFFPLLPLSLIQCISAPPTLSPSLYLSVWLCVCVDHGCR